MNAARNITARGYQITMRANNTSGNRLRTHVILWQSGSYGVSADLRSLRFSVRPTPACAGLLRLNERIHRNLEVLGYGQ